MPVERPTSSEDTPPAGLGSRTQPRATDFCGAEGLFADATVGLSQEADKEVGPVAEKIAQQDADLREWAATRIVWTFIGGNLVTLAALRALVWLDQTNIERALSCPVTASSPRR